MLSRCLRMVQRPVARAAVDPRPAQASLSVNSASASFSSQTNPLAVDPMAFHAVSTHLDDFFITQNKCIRPALQHHLDILAACEDPQNVADFTFPDPLTGWMAKFAVDQTNQMRMEKLLLEGIPAGVNGLAACMVSSRLEPNADFIRRFTRFQLYEFEMFGSFNHLIQMYYHMFEGFGFSGDRVGVVSYNSACEHFGVDILEDEHEAAMHEVFDFDVVLLAHFPMRTNPFWNMALKTRAGEAITSDTTAFKIDVIGAGVEMIGSAQRSCNVDEMRQMFYSIEGGEYAKTLFRKFGRKRTEDELEAFLQLHFIPRFGGGIGVSRLIKFLEHHNKLPPL